VVFALLIAASGLALLLVVVTCIQLLYLESLRIRAREQPALQYFKETLEAKIGLPLERGAITFSLVKHAGLAVLGCLIGAIAFLSAEFWEALLSSLAISAAATVVTAFVAPQIIYKKSTGRGLIPFVPLFRLMAVAVRPLIWLLEFLQSLFELGGEEKKEVAPSAEEHIEALIIAGEEEGLIEKGDRALIQSVVAFGDKTVREVMTPRPRIVAIGQDASLEELRRLVIHEQYSRIPAFDQDIDNITGFVHVRDMFEIEPSDRTRRRVRDVMRPIRTVPESKPVNDLLREMQEEGAHMATVVDEYGATAGIVTMEDMVEEIVGEIHDEHEPERDYKQESDGSYVVSGSFDLSRLEDLLDFNPGQDTESTTVGGLVTEWLGHVPYPGEETSRAGIVIRVLAADKRRVDQVRVSKVAATPGVE
jgi:CBS domain containing-hemolysin-like protein